MRQALDKKSDDVLYSSLAIGLSKYLGIFKESQENEDALNNALVRRIESKDKQLLAHKKNKDIWKVHQTLCFFLYVPSVLDMLNGNMAIDDVLDELTASK